MSLVGDEKSAQADTSTTAHGCRNAHKLADLIITLRRVATRRGHQLKRSFAYSLSHGDGIRNPYFHLRGRAHARAVGAQGIRLVSPAVPLRLDPDRPYPPVDE